MLISKPTVNRWYEDDVVLSLQLMDTFIRGVEHQVEEAVLEYRCSDEGEPREDGHTWHETHQGLDGDLWHLPTVFEEHFPTLHRRSVLLTLWGFCEHELNKLCLLYQREQAFSLAFIDLSGNGIDRSTNYLEKVAGLKGLKASHEWGQLKALQEIRNVIAHNDGKLNGQDGKPRIDVFAAMKKVGFVRGDYELLIEDGFLKHALNICSSYFAVIGKAIVEKGRSV